MGVPRLHRLALERSEQAVASGALCPLSTRVEPWHGSDAESFELRSLIGSPPGTSALQDRSRIPSGLGINGWNWSQWEAITC